MGIQAVQDPGSVLVSVFLREHLQIPVLSLEQDRLAPKLCEAQTVQRARLRQVCQLAEGDVHVLPVKYDDFPAKYLPEAGVDHL